VSDGVLTDLGSVDGGHRERLIRVTGAVQGRDGWPVEPATVTLIGQTGAQLGRAAVDAEGRFEIVVTEPGPATLIVASPGSVPLARSVTIPRDGLRLGIITLTRPGDSTTPGAGRWTIDPAHSTIAVTGQHLGLSRIHGRFATFAGELVVADPLERSWCSATIEAASIETGNAQRDVHLRSADFLDVERWPRMEYRGTAVEPAGLGRWTVRGSLELAGTTREVPLEVRYGGTRPDPWGGVRSGFTATARLNCEDYRMNWNQAVELGLSLVGAQVLVELDIQAVRAD
jgi:polyisoprenoid-binding protein YceI